MVTNNSVNEPTAASGKVLQGQGVGTTSAFSTATYPATTTINQILYSSAANTVTGLATANTAVLATDGSGVPSITATPTVTSITFGSGTALSNYAEGTWTPTITGASTAGSTSYTSQNGYYTRIGNLVFCQFTVVYTAATGTGLVTLGGLPFTVKNQTGGQSQGALSINNSIAFPTGCTYATISAIVNTLTAKFLCSGSSATGASLVIANAAQTFSGTLLYQI